MSKNTISKQISAEKSNRYSTARGIAGFISVMGWLCAFVGVLILSSKNFSGSSLAAAAAFIILGLLMVAGGQVINALLDIANNSWDIVENSKQILILVQQQTKEISTDQGRVEDRLGDKITTPLQEK